MKVGVYFDLRAPAGSTPDASRISSFTLEQCEEAERFGADSVWFSEHHGFDDGYLPQPLTFAAAVAARTQRVRIGTAVVIAPLRTAAQLAEDAAVVDLVSGGRLELGVGAGYRAPEYELFGADMATRYSTTDARVREVRALWDGGRVTPAPVQERVPIWLGYQGPQGAARAGRLGEGLLSVNPALVEPYRAGLAEAGHDPSVARTAGVVNAFVSEDPEADWPVVAPHVAYQSDSYRRYMVEGTGQPVPRSVDPERMRAKGLAGGMGGFTIGTPETVAKEIRAYVAASPVQTVYLWASIGAMSEAITARHVETISTKLRPFLAD